ncbi:MAG: acyl-CoA dehydrogenase family protein [Gammaproteobacteria bacterium]
MTDLSSLERLLESRSPPVSCATEAEYHALWQARGYDAIAPVAAAIAGGAVADRFAWVFAAGYQATLRNAFTALPPGGWAAFAATEDTREPGRYPGTTLTAAGDGLRLDGCKLWVGHSRLAQHLVVSVNDPGGDKRRARAVLVARDAPGVVLTHRETPGFLPAISQGYARFEGTPIAPADVIDFEPIRQFGRTEAKFVMLAASAFMLARLPATSAARDAGYAVAAGLVALLGEAETSRQVYGALDRAFQALADAFEHEVDLATLPGDAADARLLRMYTARIQRRVGYAIAEVDAHNDG